MREITSGTQRRRGCAASILSTHPDPGQVRTFWRGQLDSPDSQICWWAVVNLANAADARDFEMVLTQAVKKPDLHHVLSVRLRDWKDKRAVPCLAEFLESSTILVKLNAAGSLSLMPGCPRLDADVIGQERRGPMTLLKTDQAAPYKRWWKEKGSALFAKP